jgi:hypothetical protein
VSDERTWAAWPPPRRWWTTTGIAVVVAIIAGVGLGLATHGNSKKGSTTSNPTTSPTTSNLTTSDESLASMTGTGFTASRVGVSCQVRAEALRCSRAGLGNATLTTGGRVTIDREGDRVQGGPALAPGQDWKSTGMRCAEETGGLHCVVMELDKGFFVDASGFVER